MSEPRGTKRGFTLLELLVVVAILGLVAGVATVRLGGGYRRAQLRRAVQTVQEIDRFARQTARRQETPLELVIDVSESRFELRKRGDSSDTITSPRTLPAPIELAAARTRQEQRRSGEVVVRFDRRGQSGTYAALIATPSGVERWVAFAGATGQATESLTDRQVEDLFRALRKTRADAP